MKSHVPHNCSHNETLVVPVDVDRHRNTETVDGLIPYVQYWFQITAETHAGEGPAALLLCNTTQAGEKLLVLISDYKNSKLVTYTVLLYYSVYLQMREIVCVSVSVSRSTVAFASSVEH